MKARNREINIFNMSLLDILCGALGAFCFMMLSLLPYYRPAGEDYQKISEDQKKMLDEVKDIKDLVERLKFTSNAEDQSELVKKLQEMIQKLENQVKQLQGQVNSLMAENEALKKERERLTQENTRLTQENEKLRQFQQEVERLRQEKQQLLAQVEQLKVEKHKLADEKQFLQNRLEARLAWTVVLKPADTTQLIRTSLVETGLESVEGKKQRSFDARSGRAPDIWDGDYQYEDFRAGTSNFVAQQRSPGSVRKLYASLAFPPERHRETEVSGFVTGHGFQNLFVPKVRLTPERPWTLVGTLTVGDDKIPKFTEATQEERDIEWKRLTDTEAPAMETKPAPPPLTRTESEELAKRRMLAEESAKKVAADMSKRAADAKKMQDDAGKAPGPAGGGPAPSARVQALKMAAFAKAVEDAKADPAQQQQVLEKALKEAADDKEREQLRNSFQNLTGRPPPASEGKK